MPARAVAWSCTHSCMSSDLTWRCGASLYSPPAISAARQNFAMDTVARHTRKIFPATEHARISLHADDQRGTSPGLNKCFPRNLLYVTQGTRLNRKRSIALAWELVQKVRLACVQVIARGPLRRGSLSGIASLSPFSRPTFNARASGDPLRPSRTGSIPTPPCLPTWWQNSQHRPGGETARRKGLKIPRRKACRLESGPGYQASYR